MKFRWMLSRGRVLAGVLCQIRARQASKQSQDWFEVASHSVPAEAAEKIDRKCYLNVYYSVALSFFAIIQ